MKKLKILYITSEVFPFAKTGGLADVSGSLPVALKNLGHEVRVIMPKYKVVNERKYILREVIRLRDIPVTVGNETYAFNVKSAFIPNSKVQIYFIDFKPFFGREGLYVDGKRRKDYPDNDRRFILFARGALETLKLLAWQPNIVHVHDWQASLIPLYLKTLYKKDAFFKKISSILTIHNVGYQGVFPISTGELTALPKSSWPNPNGAKNPDTFNFLAAGITSADYVNTVSQTYAEEIKASNGLGCGMEDLLAKRKDRFTGILNGVDYSIWNPETDTNIPKPYSLQSVGQKEENKKALLKRVGLPYKKGVPVFGLISRLVSHKGVGLIIDSLPALMKLNAQFVLLGTGERRYMSSLGKARNQFPDQFSATFGFNDKLAHLIEAGADAYMMPSEYEPCGLNQMYSLRYGTVPVVRATGGLVDTVENFVSSKGTGTGIVFKDFTAEAFLEAVERAIALYNTPAKWEQLVRNGMQQDFSWDASAKEYSKLYLQAVKNS